MSNVQCKTPDDGQRNCPKHVEFRTRINLWISAFIGFNVKKFVTMHGHMNLKFVNQFVHKKATRYTTSRLDRTLDRRHICSEAGEEKQMRDLGGNRDCSQPALYWSRYALQYPESRVLQTWLRVGTDCQGTGIYGCTSHCGIAKSVHQTTSKRAVLIINAESVMAIASGVWVTVWSGRNASLLSAQMQEYSHTQHTSLRVRCIRLIVNNIAPRCEKQGSFKLHGYTVRQMM